MYEGGIFGNTRLQFWRDRNWVVCDGRQFLYAYPLGLPEEDIVNDKSFLSCDIWISVLIKEESPDSMYECYYKIDTSGGKPWIDSCV